MQAFAALFAELDATTRTRVKLDAMKDYFEQVGPTDGAWAVYVLTGRRMKRLIGARKLRDWLGEASGLPDWLVEETYQHVGDLAETVSLLMDDGEDRPAVEGSLAEWVEEGVLALRGLDEQDQKARVLAHWRRLPRSACFLYNKLLTGSLRVGVSRGLVERALAELSDRPRALIARRLMGEFEPSADFYRHLLSEERREERDGQPYPFFLASPLESEPPSLGPLTDWQAEWKWDGIRAQLIARPADAEPNQVWLWSRGEEPMAGRFPEVEAAAGALPEVVLDGELVAWKDGVLPFSEMQRRIQRKKVGDKLLREVPVAFLAYDLLEYQGRDWRSRPLSERRAALETLIADTDAPALKLSPTVRADDWAALAALRENSREHRVEGLMLKRADSPYRSGRVRGDWWKWKLDPLTLDAVLLYAQPGHGRRANLYTDYTLAVPDGGTYVPIAKAYSGLTDQEIGQLDRWIRRNTVEKFGPVRSLRPHQVFEIAFEGIQPSSRHKSGIALRFPRIARWRQDLTPDQADSLTQVKELLNAFGS
ncbi:ATP-dependent DNA ligase [Alcanivorax marinus]|uniref:DNA ligase (ATP) n=1 Tax=Alloalcanivorax marinus TaxID=1177169 RepID=A0A9Q3UHE6_9GAMM|nr:ATP-dependent DNA ligase [Alloalcanivorax marinus]MCC4307047.1 ATP-dependent DNA ligase [Alloalcanivorax marinus]